MTFNKCLSLDCKIEIFFPFPFESMFSTKKMYYLNKKKKYIYTLFLSLFTCLSMLTEKWP